MIVVLTGPNAGQSGIWGGVVFEAGRAEIPDNAAGLASILFRYYGAVPEDQAPAPEAPTPKRKGR